MKILVASSAPPDRGAGISTYCREISRALVKMGHQVVYASPPPTNNDWLDDVGCDFIDTPFDGHMKTLCENTISKISEYQVDAIINNDNAVVQNIAPLVTCPFISVGHLDSTAIGKMLLHNKDWVDYVVAISSDMQLNLVKKLNVSPHRVPMIHNGIHDVEYVERIPKTGPLSVIFGGGLIPRKGGDVIAEILRANLNNSNIHFDIFGMTPKGIPSDLTGHKHIQFHGKKPREQFMQALSQADVFLLPSRAEGCPMALLEAIAYGCVPIVSNGIGAMRWIVTNMQNGYVCRLDNWAKNASDTLNFLSENPSEILRLSQASRKTFLEEYRVEITVNRLLQLIYSPVIKRNNKPENIELIKWHRRPNSSIRQRIYYRLGWIEKAGKLR